MFSANMFLDFIYFLLFEDYLVIGEKIIENGNWKTWGWDKWRQGHDDSDDIHLSSAPHTCRGPAEMHPRLCTWREGLTKCFSFPCSREWPPSPPAAELLRPLTLPHLNLWRPTVKCAGHGKREIIWNKLSPQWTSHPACSDYASPLTICQGGLHAGGRQILQH